jgi:hypothetical protein
MHEVCGTKKKLLSYVQLSIDEQDSNQCSGSRSGLIRIILVIGIHNKSTSASNNNQDPDLHHSEKLDPEPEPDPHQFADDKPCME